MKPLEENIYYIQVSFFTRGHGQQCGDCWGEGSIRGLNGNGKKCNKDYLEKKKMTFLNQIFPLTKSIIWGINCCVF